MQGGHILQCVTQSESWKLQLHPIILSFPLICFKDDNEDNNNEDAEDNVEQFEDAKTKAVRISHSRVSRQAGLLICGLDNLDEFLCLCFLLHFCVTCVCIYVYVYLCELYTYA